MSKLKKELRVNIVQQLKTIKLPNFPNAYIVPVQCSYSLPNTLLGTIEFYGNDKFKMEIHLIDDYIKYYNVVDNNLDPQPILVHNVHESIDMNLRCISRSLNSLIYLNEFD